MCKNEGSESLEADIPGTAASKHQHTPTFSIKKRTIFRLRIFPGNSSGTRETQWNSAFLERCACRSHGCKYRRFFQQTFVPDSKIPKDSGNALKYFCPPIPTKLATVWRVAILKKKEGSIPRKETQISNLDTAIRGFVACLQKIQMSSYVHSCIRSLPWFSMLLLKAVRSLRRMAARSRWCSHDSWKV